MKQVIMPSHLAIILDGNGRWAKRRGLPRTAGHAKGIGAIKSLIKNVLKTDIKHLSLFTFSTENWKRPKNEVSFLLFQLNEYLNKKTIKLANKNNIKVNWIGFENNISKKMLSNIKNVVENTKQNSGLNLNIFFNYGGIQDIEQAAKKIKNNELVKTKLLTADLPAVDLLVRTGSEKRISNFLIYDIAYAEIIFEKKLWPSYTNKTLKKNLKEFSKRNRRYGGLNVKKSNQH